MGLKDIILNSKQKAEIAQKDIDRVARVRKEEERRLQLTIVLNALPTANKTGIPFEERLDRIIYESGFVGEEEDIKETNYDRDYIFRLTDQDVDIIKEINEGLIIGKFKTNDIRAKGANIVERIEKEMRQSNKKSNIGKIVENEINRSR